MSEHEGTGRPHLSQVQLTRQKTYDEITFNLSWGGSYRYSKGHDKEGCWDAVWVFLKYKAKSFTPVPVPTKKHQEVLRQLDSGDAHEFIRRYVSQLAPDWLGPSALGALAQRLAQGRPSPVKVSVSTNRRDRKWTLTIQGPTKVLGSEPGQVTTETYEVRYKNSGFGIADTSNRWKHLELTGVQSAPPGAEVVASEDGAGVFVFRSADNASDMPSPVKFEGITVRVTPLDAKSVDLWLFGIEMVHIPKGDFHLGDPAGVNGPTSCFYNLAPSRNGGQTYQVQSEDEIVLGKRLTFDAEGGDPPKGVIPREFPKGHQAFYLMKSLVSQGEYADFISSLSGNARTLRYPYGGQGDYRFTLITLPDYTRVATRPLRPCNWLSWGDGSAYAAWAGLRPMTELEYEKACRGPAAPVSGEYAWGTTQLRQAEVIMGPEDGTEAVNGNCLYGQLTLVGGDGGQGPVRDDAFAAPDQPNSSAMFPPGRVKIALDSPGKGGLCAPVPVDDRENTGTSYYGIRSLSGNLWEQCVTAGNEEGRRFSGRASPGRMGDLGIAPAEALGWPDETAVGAGLRGGSWFTGPDELCVADRTFATGLIGYFTRSHDTGFRCARTAPLAATPALAPAKKVSKGSKR